MEDYTMKKMKQMICYSFIAFFALQIVSNSGVLNITQSDFSYKIRCNLPAENG